MSLKQEALKVLAELAELQSNLVQGDSINPEEAFRLFKLVQYKHVYYRDMINSDLMKEDEILDIRQALEREILIYKKLTEALTTAKAAKLESSNDNLANKRDLH